jgi:hypothetical protein
MRWLLVVLLFFLLACRGALAKGEAEFKRGCYPAAKQVFASLEVEMRTRDAAARAEYALYRGLTLEALGDRSRAALWLHEAKALEDRRSGTLRPEDARRLAVAMEANEVP